MLLRSLLPIAALTSAAFGEVLEFELKAGKSRTVNVPSNVDDNTFTEPRGYAVHGARARSFIQRVELRNTSDKPLKGRLLTVNEQDLTNIEGLQHHLGLSAEPGRQALTMQRLFAFWKDHRSHAGCGLPLANEPFATLNFWGYTLCGEDTQALARLAHAFEIPARHVQLNGHIAGEYRYDGAWHMVDGDQNAVYLKLDNRTLASADDIRQDPFLALRTKIFGKHSPQELSASAFNTALIEHVAPAEPKPIKLKSGPAPVNTFTLHPEETLVWHCDAPPETPVGKLGAEKADALREAALATIEHRAFARNGRKSDNGEVLISSPFPIWKAVNTTTGAVASLKPDEVAFRAAIPVKSDDDELAIFSQCSRLALPMLTRGDSIVKLDAKDGAARVTVNYDPGKNLQPPSARLSARAPLFTSAPVFTVEAPAKADRLWWQISATRDFAFVAPSLEGVMPASRELRVDPLTETFLNPATPYFARIKVRQEGLWSEWSEAAEFRVAKPGPATEATFESAGGGFVRLSWKGSAKAEFLIFGSNRRDFVPELFSDTEIAAMDHTKVTKTRENKNLIATVQMPEHEFAPQHRFFRIIARSGGIYSVPGPLLTLSPELAKDLPPPTVLQVRASKQGTKDVYRATEEQLTEVVPPPTAAAKPAQNPR